MIQKLKTGFFILCSVLFTLFAALQYNDPDPQIWISAYMIVSLISIISIYRNIPWYILVPFIFLYTGGALFLWPETYMGVTMPMSHRPEIELARESLGLGISALALSLTALISYFHEKKLKMIRQME